VYAGLRADGILLLEGLASKERRKIFREWEKDLHDENLEDFPGEYLQAEEARHGTSPDRPDNMEEVERAYFREGITGLLAFLFLGINEGNIGEFDDLLESALSKAANESGRVLEEFDLTVKMSGAHVLTPQTIAERVREGDSELTVREVVFAFEKDALGREELETYFEQFDLGHLAPLDASSDSSDDE
jgi:hypothetical protein